MKFAIKLLMISIFVSIMVGCGAPHMMVIKDASVAITPQPGKALVVFLRPARMLGDGNVAVLYDGDQYLGTSTVKTIIPYQAEPGKHLFMVIGESADFMEAELAAGKTYYAVVQIRPGVFGGRFSFHPQNGQLEKDKIDAWLKVMKPMEPAPAGLAYAEKIAANSKAKKDKYLPEFEQKGADKTMLNKDSGV